MKETPFAQTFLGAVLVAVFAGLIVWLLTGRAIFRSQVVSAAATPTPAPQSIAPSEPHIQRQRQQTKTSQEVTSEGTSQTSEPVKTAVPPISATIASASPVLSESDQLAKTRVDLHTNLGDITLRFFPSAAPIHVSNFIDLAKSGFYTGTKFHRIIPGFMIQGGDPNTIANAPETWGTGGSGKALPAEFNSISHARGILSMARANDPNSASSQFFICVADSPFLDRQYTVFGAVENGLDVVDNVVNAPRGANDRPLSPVVIRSVTVRHVP